MSKVILNSWTQNGWTQNSLMQDGAKTDRVVQEGVVREGGVHSVSLSVVFTFGRVECAGRWEGELRRQQPRDGLLEIILSQPLVHREDSTGAVDEYRERETVHSHRLHRR